MRFDRRLDFSILTMIIFSLLIFIICNFKYWGLILFMINWSLLISITIGFGSYNFFVLIVWLQLNLSRSFHYTNTILILLPFFNKLNLKQKGLRTNHFQTTTNWLSFMENIEQLGNNLKLHWRWGNGGLLQRERALWRTLKILII